MKYSFKRITQYIPKKASAHTLKRILFIKQYMQALNDDNTVILVLDEVGFGT